MEENNYRESMRTARIMHWFITLMPPAFAGFVWFTNTTNPIGELTADNKVLLYVPAILLLTAIPASAAIFRNYLRAHAPAPTAALRDKLGLFHAAHLIRLSFLEAAALSAGVVCLMTNTLMNLGLIAVAFLVMIALTPTPYRISEAMNLSQEERGKLSL